MVKRPGILGKLSLVLLIVFSAELLFATIQPGDTLMSRLANEKGEQKVKTLVQILEAVPQLPHLKAIDYAQEGIIWSKEYNDEECLARLYNFLGNRYYMIGSYDLSLENYQEALRLTMRIGEKEAVAVLMQKLGIINFSKNDYKRSLLYFQQTLKIYQELGFSIREAELYTSIGAIFFYWEEYEKALENYDRAFNIYKELDHLNALSDVLFNKGITNQKLNNYTEAQKWFKQAINVSQKLNKQNNIAKVLNAIGETFMLEHKYEDALEVFEKAYLIQKKTNDRIVVAQSLNNLGNVYKEMNHFQKSTFYLEQSLKIATELDLTLTIMDNYKSYYELYYIQDRSHEALKYYQMYVSLRDSIFNAKQPKSELPLTNISNGEDLLELKKIIYEQDKRMKNWSILLFGLIFILVIIIGIQKNKLNKSGHNQ